MSRIRNVLKVPVGDVRKVFARLIVISSYCCFFFVYHVVQVMFNVFVSFSCLLFAFYSIMGQSNRKREDVVMWDVYWDMIKLGYCS